MIYTPMTKRALALCFEAHKDQLDKSGLPYVFHPFHLAEQMSNENTTVVALLHDVAEDTNITIEQLQAEGFGEQVIAALRLLTHDPCEPYLSYVARIAQDPVARAVKLADLRHNSDLTRLDTIDDRALARVEKYKAAMALLEEQNLAHLKDEVAGSLPYGAQRRLEIVRALATDPAIILLDEPAAGMNPSETEELMHQIRRIRDTFQIAIFLIEHDMNLVMGICEGICVLNFGKVIAKGTPEEIKENPAVIEAYLGRKDG